LPSPTAAALEQLVVAATGGDREAFGKLVTATSRLVAAIALAELRDVEASRDVAQEVFLVVHEDLSKLQNPRSFLPFLREVTRARARRLAERRSRQVGGAAAEAALEAAADHRPLPDARLQEAERAEILHEAFDALPEDAREVLALYYLEGHSTSQVAALLGLGEAAVHQRLSRARGRLREDLLRRFGEAAEAGAPAAGLASAVLTALPAQASAAAGVSVALASTPKWAGVAAGGVLALGLLLALLPRGGGPGGGPGPAATITVARPAGERAPGDPAAQPTPRDEAPPPPSGQLRVKITSGEHPVSGASVRAWRQLPVAPAADRPAWRLAAERVAGEEGVVELPAAPGRWLVSARAPGLAAGQVEVYRPEGEEVTRVELALAPAAGLAGRVVERPGGAPVPLATLVLVRETRGLYIPSDVPFEERLGAVADASGGFAFPDAGPGRYALFAEAPGRARTVVRNVEVPLPWPLEVGLAAAAVLEGHVVGADGRPASGAELALSGGEEVLAAAAGPSGGFSVEVAAGAYTLSARAGSATGSYPGRLVVGAGQHLTGLVVRLGDEARFEGRVTGEGGRALPGAIVLLSGCEDGGEIARAMAGDDGRYALGPLAPGEYDLEVLAEGFAGRTRQGLVLLAGQKFTVDFALARSGAIEGQVTGPDGRPIEGATVRAGGIYSLLGDGLAVTGPEGRYRLGAVPAGQTRVQASRAGSGSLATLVVSVGSGQAARADFVLPELATVEGSVTREGGRPLEGVVQVSLMPERSTFWNRNLEHARILVGADGRYRALISAGAWRAAAVRTDVPVAAGAMQERQLLVLAPGGTVRLDLTLGEPPAAFVVEVREPGGAPADGAKVVLRRADGAELVYLTREDGRAAAALEGPGAQWTAHARHQGRMAHRAFASEENPLVLELQPGASLAGRVSDPTGRPVHGFTLALEPADWVTSAAIARSFASDHFVFEELPAVPGRVTAMTTDGRVGSATVALAPGARSTADISVQASARVQARIADAEGRPVPGFLLVGFRRVTNDPEFPDANPEAIRSGLLSLGGLPPGEVEVRLVAARHAMVTRTVSLTPGATVDLGTVRLERVPPQPSR